LVVHQVVLTFGDHVGHIESIIFGSLSFIFGQILVWVIWLYQNIFQINYCFFNNKKKPKITSRLQLFCNHLQYANSVDKKHEEKNGIGFAKKCWNGPHE
jgi:hypothetical protein